MTTVLLTPLDLVLAAVFTLMFGLVSLLLNLGLERSLAIAVVRLVGQLALVSLALKFVLEQKSIWLTAAVVAVMAVFAGLEAVSRQTIGARGPALMLLSTVALAVVALSTTMFAMALVIGPTPWWNPRYLIPILGMVLGNGLTALSLVLGSLFEAVRRERQAIDARLALGHTRWEAFSGPVRSALIAGLTPTLNAMSAAGIVSLPGMMTGQIIAGADPIEAAKYQIVILLLLAGASALCALAGTAIAVSMSTDARQRLRLDRLLPNDGK